MKKRIIAGIAIIPGLLNPAMAGFRFEGLQAYSHAYCEGHMSEAEAAEALRPAVGAEIAPPSINPPTWVAYGCRNNEGRTVRRGNPEPSLDEKGMRK